MTDASKMMKLGLFFEGGGHHIAAWRDPGVDVHARQTFEHFAEIARTAERGKFDLLFTADTYATFGSDDVETWRRTTAASRLEPLTLLGALSVITEKIGLVATMTSTYFEPYHVARFFASLDQISNGRAGWNLVTSLAAAEALNFNRDSHVSHADRYDRAREFARVVLGLWDSWEDGAVIADKESGLFFDRDRLHFLNHKGKHFSVRGPLTVHPSLQGHPVIVQAGQSDDGRDLAAETAEVIFTVQQDLIAAKEFYADIKRRAVAYGRSPDSIKVMPGIMTVIGTTREEAQAKYDSLQNLIHPEVGIRVLSSYFGMDMSQFPLDGPVPEPVHKGAEIGRLKVMVDLAKRENLSIRQLYMRVVGQRAHRTVCGTPNDIADAMESWFTAGACDGFNVLPLTFPNGLNDLVDLVVPELQRRGLFRKEYEGNTLRENLGLPRPVNRYTQQRSQITAAE
ncbi:MAG TPA: LLM class flavin-dependent oxidoreductase [Xanthobacteraceae bacterium]|nr:LLM class flavin-dependent oxidoreductase [Xanthobacteraceae bacterium]